MRTAIIGPGAIGCLYGAYLSRKNEVVMLCKTQAEKDTINRNGITVTEPDGHTDHYSGIRAFLSGEYTEKADLVIVIVKSMDTADAVSANLDVIGENTMVMTLQNGGGNDLILSEYIPAERIVIGTTRHNSVNVEIADIRHSGSGETFIGSNARNADLSGIAQVFEEAGFRTVISDDIQRIIWSKLFVNLSVNTFTALARAPIGSILDNPYGWSFAESLIREAVAVAEAEGQHFVLSEVMDAVRRTCEEVATGYSSMSQDVMNGRRTEIDGINGFVVRRAEVHGIPAPYNTFVWNLIRAIELTYKH